MSGGKETARAWVARDKDGCLHLFRTRPYKYRTGELPVWTTWDGAVLCHLPDAWLPGVRWTDEEATEVEIRPTGR